MRDHLRALLRPSSPAAAVALLLVLGGLVGGCRAEEPTVDDPAATLRDHVRTLAAGSLEVAVTVTADVAAGDAAGDGLRVDDLAAEGRTLTIATAEDGSWRVAVADDGFTWIDVRGTGPTPAGTAPAEPVVLLARVNALRLARVAGDRVDADALQAVAAALPADDAAAAAQALANERWIGLTAGPTGRSGATAGAELLDRLVGLDPREVAAPALSITAAALQDDRIVASTELAIGRAAPDGAGGRPSAPVVVPARLELPVDRAGTPTGPLVAVVELTAPARELAAGPPTPGSSEPWAWLAPLARSDGPLTATVTVAPGTAATTTGVEPAATVALERLLAALPGG
jgi:hypothetical protein